MGINFKQTIKGKIGDIIYPAYNGTNSFCQKPRWDLVLAVDKKGNITERRYLWDWRIVDAIESMIELKTKLSELKI